jgi:hypothetical protein
MKPFTLQKTDLKSRKQRIRLCLLVSLGILLVVGTVCLVAPSGSLGFGRFHLAYGKIPFPSPAVSKGLMHVGTWKTVSGREFGAALNIKGSVWAIDLRIDARD